MAVNRTSPYTVEKLRKLLIRLKRTTNLLESAIAYVESSGEPLYVFNESSQVDGLRRFAGFERELSDAMIAAESGQPNTSETLKAGAILAKKKAAPTFRGITSAHSIAASEPAGYEHATDVGKRKPAKKSRPATKDNENRKLG